MSDQHDWARELQSVLYHEIPLSQQIGLQVDRYEGASLSLRAPLAPNINHKSTAFAGSLTAVATLAGWGLTWLLLRQHDLRGVIVIHESATRYQLPVAHDFVAVCHAPDALAVERFLTALRRRGKARLALTVEIQDAEQRIAVVFTGSYVAFIDQTDDRTNVTSSSGSALVDQTGGDSEHGNGLRQHHDS
ncbi:MAG TPA: thioesterase domain-containing protein [Ktedonobacterales bacterium]|jgi:thioesterase domain-containing protein|nr:thioesterase domain-containing protein [Ktedonobacterales bacterium]